MVTKPKDTDHHHYPRPLGRDLSEPIYDAILKSMEEGSSRLNVLISVLHPSDIADLLERLHPEQRKELIHMVPADVIGPVISELSEGVQESLLNELSAQELKNVVGGLESDDVTDLIQNMDEELASKTLKLISKSQKDLLDYPEDTAGGIMQLEFFNAPALWTVDKTLRYIRTNSEKLPENLRTLYVTDKDGHLEGTVSLSRLVRLEPTMKLEEVMRTDPVQLAPEMSQQEVAEKFEKYDLFSCPVVDHDGVLLGQITIDDVLDVVIEEHEKRQMRQVGLEEGEDLFAPIALTTRRRFPWLLVNLFTAILASMVIAIFEEQIAQLVALAILMPIVASMGGNAGTQTLAVTVRGLATHQITMKNALYLLRKEIMVGGLNGVLLAVVLGLGTGLVFMDVKLGAVIAVATIANHIFAALAGHLIPVLLERFNKDPAISSGVLVTTVTDVGGFFVFLGLAALFLL